MVNLIYMTPTWSLTRTKDREEIKEMCEEVRQRSQSSSPATFIKMIHKIEDENLVRGIPGVLFEQDQETTTASELVSEGADPRRRPSSHHSDGMWLEMGRYLNGTRMLQSRRLTDSVRKGIVSHYCPKRSAPSRWRTLIRQYTTNRLVLKSKR